MFGQIEGIISLYQQLGGSGGLFGETGATDADGQMVRLAIAGDEGGRFDEFSAALGQDQPPHGAGIGQQNHEFLAAIAEHHVGLANNVAQALA